MDGVVGTGGEVGAESSFIHGSFGSDLDGALIDLFDTDIFPGNHSGMAFGALEHVVVSILDGDVVISQEDGHGVDHLRIQNGLEGVHKGVGVDGIAVGPLGLFTDGELPGQLVDLLGHIGSQVGNVVVTHAVLIGNSTPQIGMAPGQGRVIGSLDSTHAVHGIHFGGQIGVENLLVGFSGLGGCGVGGGRSGGCGGSGSGGRLGRLVVAAGSGQGQQHQGGHHQSDQLFTHDNISFCL